jgi:hypothetical protein
MKNYNVQITRKYVTDVTVEAESHEDAIKRLSLVDIYQMELEQCNVTEEEYSVQEAD